MAAAGATLSSCLSTHINSKTKHLSSSNVFFRIGCTRTLQQVGSISHVHSIDALSIKPVANKRRNVRIAASVTEEEVAEGVVEAANVEEKQVVEEEVVEGGSEVEVEVEAEAETEVEAEGVVEAANVEEKEVVEEEVVEGGSEVEVEVEAEAETEVEAEAEAEGVAEPTASTKLYFGNLPYNCDSAQLAGIIQDYGSPELVEVLYDRATGRSRGFAFVTMSNVEDCNTVIQNLDGSLYGGRPMRVNFADKPKPKEPLYPETEYKLFVGNLSWSVTSESLTEAFRSYGEVVGARVLYDGDTGRSRGYGFVCFNTKEEMEVALTSLNGMELDGRAMRVSLAQGKRSS